MVELTPEEEGILTAYQILRWAGTTVPETVLERVEAIYKKLGDETPGTTLNSGPIGPWG
jgi:hypothetical protein